MKNIITPARISHALCTSCSRIPDATPKDTRTYVRLLLLLARGNPVTVIYVTTFFPNSPRPLRQQPGHLDKKFDNSLYRALLQHPPCATPPLKPIHGVLEPTPSFIENLWQYIYGNYIYIRMSSRWSTRGIYYSGHQGYSDFSSNLCNQRHSSSQLGAIRIESEYFFRSKRLERWINSRSISCDVCYFTVLRKKYLKKRKKKHLSPYYPPWNSIKSSR